MLVNEMKDPYSSKVPVIWDQIKKKAGISGDALEKHN
jgi:hypothetical protein